MGGNMKAFLVILLAFSLVSVCGGYKLPASQVYGELSMVNHKITDLAAPSEDTDAATKAYADSVAVGGGLPITGGEMKGQIDVGGFTVVNSTTPTNDTDLATKDYVDSNSGSGLPTTGGTMSGQIDFGGIPALNVGASVNDTDAAIRSDVTGLISAHNSTQFGIIARDINAKTTKLYADPNSDYIAAIYPNGTIIASATTKAGNQAVVQAAFDSLNETHFVIECFGDYAYLNDSITMPDKLVWFNNHLCYYPLPGYSHEIAVAFEFDSLVSAKYGTIRMYDVVIDGNDKTRFVNGINLSRVQNSRIDSLYVLHSKSHGVILHDDCWWNTFTSLDTYDNGGYGLYMVGGSNDKPNANNFLGCHISCDDGGGVWNANGAGNTFDACHIDSTGTAYYIVDDSNVITNGFIEACTNGIYVGDGVHTVTGLAMYNNRFYSVINPRVFVAFTTNTFHNEGNTVDGEDIDTMYGWSSGTGSEQAIAYDTNLIGSPYDVRCWYIKSGSSAVPSFYTNEATKTLNVTADSGRLYRYVVHTSE